MARPRTGTIELRPDGWHARLTLAVLKDGRPILDAKGRPKTERRWVKLDTLDKARARRLTTKLVAEIAAGRLVADAKESMRAPETVESAARAWCASRKARGVAMADTELGYFVHHVFPSYGLMPLAEVRRVHCKGMLDGAAGTISTKTGKTLAKGTVGHLRRLLVRFFNTLEADEVIPSNPMRSVKMPEMKQDKRPRTPLKDEEYNALLAAPVDFSAGKASGRPKVPEVEFFEMKVIAFTARVLGGARAAECLRWDWTMIDRDAFAVCKLARAKTGEIQELEFPDVLKPFLRGWWQTAGRPEHGPVFPVTRGKRKGEARGKSNLAGRYRRALQRAGVTRHELHHDTAYSRKTDFHTLRRAYVSGLAASGMNEQSAMTLAHHHDSDVHRRYNQAQIKAVPLAALPQINPDTVLVLARRVDDSIRAESETGLFLRAGHGIRTRDIQLGKSSGVDGSAVLRGESASPGNMESPDSPSRFTVLRGDLPRVDDCPMCGGSRIDGEDELPIEHRAREAAIETYPDVAVSARPPFAS